MNATHTFPRCFVATLAVLATSFVLKQAGYCAAPADLADGQGVEVLTRGPVHEAFASVISFNPEPGIIVPKAPPEAVEEAPPVEKPAGDNVAWIPGYWAWDDERSDFVWVSGVWRALPPGRQWVPGYWVYAGNGYQWVSGYWADANASVTTYLPAPPLSLETGPNIPAPSPDYYWTPGCWIWYGNRYVWRPGYWVVGRPDWAWCPAYYTWTPRGYVFVDGYWDYSVENRGVLFAPVYFVPAVYAPPVYYYSPAIVINLTVLPNHFFCRPRYNHCYFGDYYAAHYNRAGYYASFSYQSKRYGYDPIYSHKRWEHRNNPNWSHQVAASYQHRRDHADARPPRTWAAQTKVTASAVSKDQSLAVATSFDQMSKRKDNPAGFRPVAGEERRQISQRDQEIRTSRDQRRAMEASPVTSPNVTPRKPFQPSTVKFTQSPIVSEPIVPVGRNQSPHSSVQVPAPNSNIVPKRQVPSPNAAMNRNNPQSELPTGAYRLKPIPAQGVTPPAAQQSPQRGANPQSVQPAKQQSRGNDKGEPHGERRGQQAKVVEQKSPWVK